MKKIVIFISGRGSNMKRIIEETKNGVLQGIAEVVLVFSNNPDARGLNIAQELGIETQSIISKGKSNKTYHKELINLLKNYHFDYIILAGYMKILSKEFVQKYPKKIINIHPADTKKHQGLHAYEWAFENKLSETKITVHYVDEGVDTGNIIAQKTVNLSGCKTPEEVALRGLAIEHQFYPKVLKEVFTKKH